MEFIFVLAFVGILITCLSIEAKLKRNVQQNEEMIKLLTEIRDKDTKFFN